MDEPHGPERWHAPRTAEERVESLIAAAAAVADRVGIDQLTTTLVAQRAGSSIGTVYRYFPDRMGVIEGLRDRNAAILHDRIHEALAEPLDGWDAVIAAIHATLVGAYREVPGFRVVTTRDWLGDDDATTLACIDRLSRSALARLPRARRGAVSTERLSGAVRILDALLRSAFQASSDGDPALLDLAMRHALDEVGLAPGAVLVDRSRLLGEVRSDRRSG